MKLDSSVYFEHEMTARPRIKKWKLDNHYAKLVKVTDPTLRSPANDATETCSEMN